MTQPLTRSPLVTDRRYRDRQNRVWHVLRVTNAGRIGPAALPALALATCITGADETTRLPQWFCADTGMWSQNAGHPTPIDLVRPA